MKATLAVAALILATSFSMGQDSKRLEALEKRVQALEKRVSDLAASTAPVVAEAEAKRRVNIQVAKARKRMRQDATVYSHDDLKKIEELYQVANHKWRTQEGKESLKQLIEKYDKANRTGCALLYLGQMSQGKDRETYLQRAIDGFSDCYYGDGVQVGPYARFYLAHYYKANGNPEKANVLFNEINAKYPNAIDHKGRPLADLINK